MERKHKKREKKLRLSGWLVKKRKRRFFLLVNEWLYWFNKEPPTSLANERKWEFLPKANGKLYLVRCNVATSVDKERDFVIINPSGKNYTLQASNVEERDHWVEIISSLTDVESKSVASYTGQMVEKRGTLTLKGKQYWFVLKEGTLMWFPNENDPNLAGSTTLNNATVALGTTKAGVGFVIATVDKKYVLTVGTREEAEEWVSYLRTAISVAKQQAREASKSDLEVGQEREEMPSRTKILTADWQVSRRMHQGWLLLEDQSMFFLLLTDVLMWFKNELPDMLPPTIQKHLKGHILLTASLKVSNSTVDSGNSSWKFGLKVIAPGKKLLEVYARTSEERDEWTQPLSGAIADAEKLVGRRASAMQQQQQREKLERSGFLVRKRQKRWVSLQDGMVLIFDKQQATTPKQTIPLLGCSVMDAVGPEDKSFMLFTPQGLEIFESCARKSDVRRDKDDWLYVLYKSVVASQRQAPGSLTALPTVGRGTASASDVASAVDSTPYAEQRRTGYLRVGRKQQRMFFTLRHISLLWYLTDQLLEFKGSLLLCGCSLDLDAANITIRSSDEKPCLQLVADNAEDAAGWALALEEVIGNANEERGFRKFGWLERKGKKRWVAVSSSHLFFSTSPQKLEDLRADNPQRNLNMHNLKASSVTTQGELAIVVTERIPARKGQAEKLDVSVFTCPTHDEQKEWLASLVTSVSRDFGDDYMGIPFSVYTFHVPENNRKLPLLLEGMSLAADSIEETSVLELPQKSTLLPLLSATSTLVGRASALSTVPVKLEGHRVLWDLGELAVSQEDNFLFRVSSGTLRSENLVRVSLSHYVPPHRFYEPLTPERDAQQQQPQRSLRLSSPKRLPPKPPSFAKPNSPLPPLPPVLPALPPKPLTPVQLPPMMEPPPTSQLPPPPLVPVVAPPATTGGPRKSPRAPQRKLPSVPTAPLRSGGKPPPIQTRPLPHAPLRSPQSRSDPKLPTTVRPLDLGLLSPVSPLGVPKSPVPIAFTAQVFFFQRLKQQLDDGHWVDVAEDLTKVLSPEALLAKQKLEAMLLEPESELVQALLALCPITEADQVVQSLVNVYENQGVTVPLIQHYIKEEVAESKAANTLFRTNSKATKMMKFYSDIIGSELLKKALSEPLQAVIASGNSLELNPQKLEAEGGADELVMERNREELKAACRRFLASITATARHSPPQFHKISRYLADAVGEKFPDARYTAIGGFLFLRYFCPAIVAPESHGLVRSPPNMAVRRACVLIAKTLQNLSNNVTFQKEEFMMPLNGFLAEQRAALETYFEEMASGASEAAQQESHIPREVVTRSIDTLYKHILLQKSKIHHSYPALYQRLSPIIRQLGIPPRLKRVLAAMKKRKKEGSGDE